MKVTEVVAVGSGILLLVREVEASDLRHLHLNMEKCNSGVTPECLSSTGYSYIRVTLVILVSVMCKVYEREV